MITNLVYKKSFNILMEFKIQEDWFFIFDNEKNTLEETELRKSF